MKKMKRKMGRTRLDDKKLDRHQKNVFNKGVFLYMTPELHALVKYRANERNITMRQWITRAVIISLRKEWMTD